MCPTASFPVTFTEPLNQSVEYSSCEDSLRTSSDSTSDGDGSADTISDTSVSKINATRTTGLTKICEHNSFDTSQAYLNKTLESFRRVAADQVVFPV